MKEYADLLQSPIERTEEWLPGVRGLRALLMRVFLSLIDPELARFAYACLEWSKDYVLERGNLMRIEHTVTTEAILKISLRWRVIASWNTDDWNRIRKSLIADRIKHHLHLVELWKQVVPSFRRTEIYALVDRVIGFYLRPEPQFTDKDVDVFRQAQETDMKNLVRPESPILYENSVPAILTDAVLSNAPISTDIVLFLIYSMDSSIGSFARLPFYVQYNQQNHDRAKILQDTRALVLLNGDDIRLLHRRHLERNRELVLFPLQFLIFYAMRGDSACLNQPNMLALLACMDMSFNPLPGDEGLARFTQGHGTIKRYYEIQCENIRMEASGNRQ